MAKNNKADMSCARVKKYTASDVSKAERHNERKNETYSGIGADKLRELSDREDCEFVLWNGTKRLIKRKKLDEFLERAYSI